jgi:hypothetical protein
VSSSLQQALQEFVSANGYWAIALIVGLESMGIPLPGETILVLAAIYAAADPTLNIWVVIAAATIGSVTMPDTGSAGNTPTRSSSDTVGTLGCPQRVSKLANIFSASMAGRSSS